MLVLMMCCQNLSILNASRTDSIGLANLGGNLVWGAELRLIVQLLCLVES